MMLQRSIPRRSPLTSGLRRGTPPEGEENVEGDMEELPVDSVSHEEAAPAEEERAPELNEALKEQLGSATLEIAQQLKGITEEMNRLKSELYSNDGGLGGIAAELERIKEEAGGLQNGPPAERPTGRPRPAPAGGSTTGPMRRVGFRDGVEAPASAADRDSAGAEGPMMHPSEMANLTKQQRKELNRQLMTGRRQNRAQPPAKWAPFMIGAMLVSLGPLRPLLWVRSRPRPLASPLVPSPQ